jgi:PTS system N-acetylgalactosamine-specific IIC component
MLLKILLISLFAGICGLDGDNTLIHFHRPIVAGAIVGGAAIGMTPGT